MKVICPVPEEIQIKQNLTPLSAAFAHDVPPGFLPPETATRLAYCEMKGREFQARIKLWTHDAHIADYERIIADLKKNPSPENEAALRKAGSRQDHANEYSRMRITLTKGLAEFMTKEMLPIVIPLLRAALDAVENTITEFEWHDVEAHKEFRVPLQTHPDGATAKPVPVPHWIVREVRRLVAGHRDRCELAQKDMDHPIGVWQGAVLPSGALREFVYFED
jgi:hypothetical protein